MKKIENNLIEDIEIIRKINYPYKVRFVCKNLNINIGEEVFLENYSGIVTNIKKTQKYIEVEFHHKMILLTGKKHKIFENLTNIEIIKKILNEYNLEFKNLKDTEKKEFLIQYDEDDINFINKLLLEINAFFLTENNNKIIFFNLDNKEEKINITDYEIIENIGFKNKLISFDEVENSNKNFIKNEILSNQFRYIKKILKNKETSNKIITGEVFILPKIGDKILDFFVTEIKIINNKIFIKGESFPQTYVYFPKAYKQKAKVFFDKDKFFFDNKNRLKVSFFWDLNTPIFLPIIEKTNDTFMIPKNIIIIDFIDNDPNYPIIIGSFLEESKFNENEFGFKTEDHSLIITEEEKKKTISLNGENIDTNLTKNFTLKIGEVNLTINDKEVFFESKNFNIKADNLKLNVKNINTESEFISINTNNLLIKSNQINIETNNFNLISNIINITGSLKITGSLLDVSSLITNFQGTNFSITNILFNVTSGQISLIATAGTALLKGNLMSYVG